jgi:hypothetical protein
MRFGFSDSLTTFQELQGRGNMYVSIGLGGDPAKLEPLGEDGELFGKVVRFQPNGRSSEVADIAAYEAVVNPDDGVVDSNPYSLDAGPGFLAVVDEGGNALLGVHANREISTLAVFDSRLAPAPPFLYSLQARRLPDPRYRPGKSHQCHDRA